MEDCIFCKIINGQINSKLIYEDDNFVIFNDINPKAKNHFLAVPKQHFSTIALASDEQLAVIAQILAKLPELNNLLDLSEGYRIIINQGENGGQEVPHLHIHILSGEKLDNM